MHDEVRLQLDRYLHDMSTALFLTQRYTDPAPWRDPVSGDACSISPTPTAHPLQFPCIHEHVDSVCAILICVEVEWK